MKRLAALVAGVALAAAFARPALAQAGGGVHFGLAGGESFPVSGSKDVLNNGWHAGAMLTFGVPLSPIAVRVEGTYHRMGQVGPGGDTEVLAGTANAVLSPVSLIVVKPYFVGGAGYYSVRTEVETFLGTGSETERKFGWNAGGGLAFSIRDTKLFIEARYHRVSTSGRALTYVPVSIGVMF